MHAFSDIEFVTLTDTVLGWFSKEQNTVLYKLYKACMSGIGKQHTVLINTAMEETNLIERQLVVQH